MGEYSFLQIQKDVWKILSSVKNESIRWANWKFPLVQKREILCQIMPPIYCGLTELIYPEFIFKRKYLLF